MQRNCVHFVGYRDLQRLLQRRIYKTLIILNLYKTIQNRVDDILAAGCGQIVYRLY